MYFTHHGFLLMLLHFSSKSIKCHFLTNRLCHFGLQVICYNLGECAVNDCNSVINNVSLSLLFQLIHFELRCNVKLQGPVVWGDIIHTIRFISGFRSKISVWHFQLNHFILKHFLLWIHIWKLFFSKCKFKLIKRHIMLFALLFLKVKLSVFKEKSDESPISQYFPKP